MTKSEQLTLLKAIIEQGDSDETLSAYLDIAGSKINDRAFPFGRAKVDDGDGNMVYDTTVPERYHMLQVQIAQHLLNKRGAEGQISHSESGVSRSYGSDDLPLNLISQVVPMCGVL